VATDAQSGLDVWAPCLSGVPCTDSDPCTLDLCWGVSCQHWPIVACAGPLTPCDAAHPCASATGVCDLGRGACVPCVTAADCGPAHVCSQNACLPAVPCKSDIACKGSGQVCDKTAGACVDCVTAGDCGNGEQCVAGICQPAIACGSSKDCPAVCDPASGLCVACLDATDCGDGQACSGLHQCVPATCKATTCSGGASFACKAGGWNYAAGIDCADGNTCTTDACTSGSGCSNVVNTTPCDDGNACTVGDGCALGSCVGAASDCNDNNSCTADSCDTGKGCLHTAQGGGCDDGSACTVADQCVGSVCGGAAVSCEDGEFCTADACDVALGCGHLPRDVTPCDDGDACTVATQCTGGKCQGGGLLGCDDGLACTTDACLAKSGCSHELLSGTTCSDNNACTDQDTCNNGVCISTAVLCTDSEPCTTDACDPASGCTFTDNQDPCQDGNDCSSPDLCAQGTCKPGAVIDCNDGNPCTSDVCDGKGGCTHENIKDDTVCEDGDACTLLDVCHTGVCTGAAIDCTDSNVCTADACVGGICQHTAIIALCDDKNGCTVGDKCVAGSCQSGTAVDCGADSKGCGTGECESTGSQTFKCSVTTQPDGTPCDADGNGCTVGDACKAGACLAGPAKDCAGPIALGACKIATCKSLSPSTNTCVSSPAAPGTPCNADTNGCTVGDACNKLGACAVGLPVDCTADVASCTTGVCKSTGAFTHACVGGAPKDDGTACNADDSGCTTDACKAGQCVVGGAVDCSPWADKCHTGHCKSSAWNAYTCFAAPVDCKDGNLCTDDSCHLPGGCLFAANTAVCNDSDVCTLSDACSGGICVGGVTADCDDQDACTADGCDATFGCVSKPLSCDDGDACTVDTCDATSGCSHTPWTDCLTVGVPYLEPFDCGGAKGWTLGQTTQPGVGWAVDGTPEVPGYLSAACSLNFNNGVDFQCENPMDASAVSPVIAGNALPKGTHLALRLFNNGTYEEAKYDDMSLAITTDSGLNWSELLSIPQAGNKVWTLQTIDLTPYVGKAFQIRLRFRTTDCINNKGVGGFVDDLAIYTTNCGNGVVCDDKNTCTTDTCDKLTGQCSFVSNALVCSDGNGCTNPDACKGGVCVGQAVKCDDGNGCTLDVCDPALGQCLHSPVGDATPCNDGNPCTNSDGCVATTCVGGPSPCDDGNPCTLDVCTGLNGAATCSVKPLPDWTPCDDEDACTAPDTCASGVCGGPDVCGAATVYSETFICKGLNNWKLQSVANTLLGWAVDATPAAPGYYSASCSLNFNDGKSYGTVVPAMASATSPSFALAAKASACKLSMYSWSELSGWNNETRTVALLDVETGLDLTSYAVPMDKDAGAWTPVTVDCMAALGHTVAVQLRFSDIGGILPIQPIGAGWFVDDVQVTLAKP